MTASVPTKRSGKSSELTTEQRGKASWWITGLPDGDADCGPYRTRAEAEEDRRGLARFYRFGHLRKFWTSDPGPKETKP